MQDEKIFSIIGHNIKIERTIKNLTQAKLAELIDVHEKYIGVIEAGKQNVTVRTLNKIAAALNVEITKLLQEH